MKRTPRLTPFDIRKSANKKNSEATTTITKTMTVEITVSRRLGQVTLAISARTCLKKVIGFVLDAIYSPTQ